ncbi:hypothetical protein VA7868_02285 [Vibrio aerogenes CECT 7868]|uniref:Uncharacterized protein n=1 Tax=Vibrio aerogenes CECT 7868 TaxID=1216006 RepID=A0A1M5Z4I6_9VIBR|nr:hypothetical protein [Vibrio aerogenes]SHI19177.1 hypothetical protein VA7868_02285 [Vibrio aerogenes CECT 7868]
MKNNKMKIIINVVLLVILFLPIGLYIFKFGFGIWSEHKYWSEMGSAFGGIYSPIIALLAFVVLAFQVKSQQKIDKYHYDQSFILGCKKDFDFYILELDRFLEQNANENQKVRDVLHSEVECIDEKDLLNEDIIKKLKILSDEYPKLVSIWCAMNPILAGLNVHKRFPYNHAYTGCLLKAASILSPKTCIALDKMYFSTSSGKFADVLFFWDKVKAYKSH